VGSYLDVNVPRDYALLATAERGRVGKVREVCLNDRRRQSGVRTMLRL
jgi:hypothetical protein